MLPWLPYLVQFPAKPVKHPSQFFTFSYSSSTIYIEYIIYKPHRPLLYEILNDENTRKTRKMGSVKA